MTGFITEMIQFFVFLLINGYIVLIQSKPLTECNVSKLNSNPKIFGGQPTRALEFPWMGSLQLKYFKSHNCGTTLINDEWALTAGHCLRKSSYANNWIIKFGKHILNAKESTEREFNISKVFIHPMYSNVTKVNDITLLKLSSKVDFNGKDKHLQPICLPPKALDVPIGSVCLAVGWGKRWNNESYSTILQKVRKQMIDEKSCINSWPGIDFPINSGHICFDSLENNQGVCSGDSGGPIQCQSTDGKWVQIGVASWTSNPCAIFGYPAIFTKISHFKDWIQEIISNN